VHHIRDGRHLAKAMVYRPKGFIVDEYGGHDMPLSSAD
jgi:hypothetical protein